MFCSLVFPRPRAAWAPFSVLACGLALLAGMVQHSVAQSVETPDPATVISGKEDKGFHTAEERLAAIKAAALIKPHDVSAADMRKGPVLDHGQFDLQPGDTVTCDFAQPGREMGGKTPKFGCKVTEIEHKDGTSEKVSPEAASKVMKVKFGAKDNELYAEVASTRLMWALGYPADEWTPVTVHCRGCPANPVSGSGAVSTQNFDAATMVWKYPGHKMTQSGKPDQGWSWSELDKNGRPTYERDGLKLMGAFLQHSDNKAPQQRLVCGKVHEQAQDTVCDHSVMLVQDLGATFGGGGWFTSNSTAKMNLGQWSGKKLWSSAGTEASPKACRASLRKSLTAHGGLSNPAISEEGRQFDAGLLCQLSDKQIAEMFRVSGVAAMPQYHMADGSFKAGETEDTIIGKWTDAFKKRREELASARCEWKEKPAEMNLVENPAGLEKPANFCAAKPF